MDARPSKSVPPRRASAPRNPERTRAAILNAAIAEFTSKGLSGARIDRIAKRARVNKRMIYYYFGDKERLYIAVLEEIYTAIRTAEIGLNLTDRDPADGMRELINFTWHYFIDHPEFLSLLATENFNRARYLKNSRRIRELHSPLIGMISDLLKRGAKQKIFRLDVDPVELYISIAALGFFYLSNRYTLATIFSRDLTTPDRLVARGQHIVEVIFDFLAPRPEGTVGPAPTRP
ncbi:MAG: TetR/AcrR family transcriptional regulator [Pseudorhodoplanes sp.]|nr:MAG: TetR/AcrR family transcriptional regulator [Pseudorhodoplanes sp.]